MQMSDQELAEVFEVARQTVLSMERDPDLADDLASMTIERLLTRNPEIRPGRLNAYAAQVARNLMRDEIRSRQQHRVNPKGEDWQLEEARAIFGIALHTKSPSYLAIKSERIQRRYQLAQQILASLPDRHRELLELAAEGIPPRDIAARLGYASPNAVSVTLNRIYARLRDEYAEQFSPSLLTRGSSED